MKIDKFLDAHAEVCDYLKDLTKRKNSDYNNNTKDAFSNFSSVELRNITTTERGFLTRMNDKFNRIISLVNSDIALVEDEKIEDTLLDLANYAILMNIYMKNKKNEESKKD